MSKLPRPPRDLKPTCDGKRYRDNGKRDTLSVARRQFVKAYQRINQAYARLLDWRERRNGKPKSPRAEHRLLRAIEKAIVAREALDARYAPQGFLGQPLYQNGFTIDVSLIHGNRPRHRLAKVRSSAQITLTFARRPKGAVLRVE